MANPKNIFNSNSPIVTVEVNKCCDWLGFSYSNKGWHYLCATIKKFINNPNIKYNKSLLKAYYQASNPKYIQTIWGVGYRFKK